MTTYQKCSSSTHTLGPPLDIGMDLTIASFDSISEVNMVSGGGTVMLK